MDFKKILNTLDGMEARVTTPAAPTLPKSVQLNEDAQLRVLAGQTTVLAESELMEKAVSKSQQKAAGAALAAKRGEGKAVGASKEMMKMSTKELEKFAGTKHKGLPEKKDESIEEAKDDDKYVPPKKTEKETTLPSGAKVKTTVVKGGKSQKADKEAELNWTKESIEEFNETFSQMVEAAKKDPAKKSNDKKADSKKAFEKKFGGSAKDLTKGLTAVKKDSKVEEGAKPDFLDMDKDGDKKEPMKKAVADKKKGAIGKKDESAMMPKGKKRPVKESVEQKLSFREMMKLVVESGGQQQIDPIDENLFAWATRVAKQKLGEGMKAEVYAGMVYERMGGRFQMYDVLSENIDTQEQQVSEETAEVTFVNSGYGITGKEKPTTVEVLGMEMGPGGRPVLFIKSPNYGDKMQADWDGKNNRWIVDQD